MITRFAPSPTGNLHLGHAFAAQVAFDRAQENSGGFLLRFEDIDHTRVREEFYDAIEEDLQWLGLHWHNEPWRQRNRLTHYADALETLKSQGMVYPCFCSRKEIERELAEMAHAPQGPEGPLYPGICRDISSADASEKMQQREPAWRLDSRKMDQNLSFHDRIHGTIAVDPNLLGDVVLARKDIGTSYHLAVVVDDHAQNISLVTRGEDLLPSTHVHRILQNLLNFDVPDYEHHRLIRDKTGERLAKRNRSLSIASLRKEGKSASEVLKMIAD
jgi:glutamyl-Q tRNA(Asp) synthetase